jgi:hypothetical protein
MLRRVDWRIVTDISKDHGAVFMINIHRSVNLIRLLEPEVWGDISSKRQ